MQASCSLKAGLWPKPIGLVQRSAATWRCGLHLSPRALVTTVVSRVVLRCVRSCRSYYYYYYYRKHIFVYSHTFCTHAYTLLDNLAEFAVVKTASQIIDEYTFIFQRNHRLCQCTIYSVVKVSQRL